MSSLRLLGISAFALTATLLRPLCAADSSERLLQSVPAGAPFFVHIRNLSSVRESWSTSPYLKMWAEPEIQAFFAPTIALVNSPEAQAGYAKFESMTGLAPLDFLRLFAGELVIAVTVPSDSEGMPEPHVLVGCVVEKNREKLAAAMQRLSESSETEGKGSVSQEEFQGEMIHTFFAKENDDEEPKENVSWVLVDDVVWFGYPRVAVQGVVANFKKGGADEPVTASAGFGPVYQRNPDAHAAYYLDLQSLVQLGMKFYQAQEAAKQLAAAEAEVEAGADEGSAEGDEPESAEEEGPKPSMFEQMGLTPDVIVHALGLDALRGLYAVSSGDAQSTTVTAGVTWTEQRGLLRMMAYGDAPVPQPGFVAPNWASVTAVRYKIPEIWEAVKDAARTANPMFEFMLAQQLASLKEQVGVDVERDFFGAFGDEIVRAYSFSDAEGAAPAGNEQLWAVSLANSESFNRTLEVVWAMAPQVAQQFQDREYLGHTIRTITVPLPGPGGMNLISLSYAVTPTHLFLDLGGASMIETAIQRLDGKGDSFWAQAHVDSAMKQLPPGGSSFTYQDIRQIIHSSFVQLADLARKTAAAAETAEEPTVDENGQPVTPVEGAASGKPKPGLHMFIDPDAVPSRETLVKYVGASYGAIYRDADGIRFHARYTHAP